MRNTQHAQSGTRVRAAASNETSQSRDPTFPPLPSSPSPDFCAVAQLSAQRSKDPSTQVRLMSANGQVHLAAVEGKPGMGAWGQPPSCEQTDRPLTHPPHAPLPPHPSKVGACIVSKRNEIIGVGYNGFPVGCSDDLLSWSRTGDPLDTKYLYVVHAEVNAVLNAGRGDVRGCRIYVALFPCNECAKVLIQAGICEVVYMDDKYRDEVRRARAQGPRAEGERSAIERRVSAVSARSPTVSARSPRSPPHTRPIRPRPPRTGPVHRRAAPF